MQRMPTPEGAELRLALGMRGGVSLAVWIGGACAEIDALRRAEKERSGFWWEVLQASNYSRVVVDVMAGASAGGLNGVLFATAIRHGFRMDQLLGIWREVASVEKLVREQEPWISLFDGDERFLDVVRDQLVELVAAAEGNEDESCYVDLQLSATLAEALDQPAVSPGDEKLRRSRSTARFHFRHDPRATPPRCDLEPGAVGRLAVAARATASFPMAFEAAAVRSTRPEQFEPRPHAPAPSPPPRPKDRAEAIALLPPLERAAALNRLRLVDCAGVFSESRGGAKAEDAAFDQDDFVVADGGIVDNVPLGKALDAIRDAPADGPTRRVLVYLHPTGPAGIAARAEAAASDETADEREVRRRGPVTMAAGVFASHFQGESIDGDLEQLEEHNRAVRLAAVLRQAVLDEVTAEGEGLTPVELARSRAAGYLVQRAGADAVLIQRLLRDPLGVLGEDPFPRLPVGAVGEAGLRLNSSDDRWRSPLAQWTADQRLDLDLRLRELFTDRLGNSTVGMDILKGGLGPVNRAIHHLLELARDGEKVATDGRLVGEQKPRLYRLASLVREINRFRQMGWVAAAGGLDQQESVKEWSNATLIDLNLLLRCDETDATTLCGNDADGDEFGDAYGRYFGTAAARLQAIIERQRVTAPPTGTVDIREAVVAQLAMSARAILSALDLPVLDLPMLPPDAQGAPQRSGAELIRRVLLDESVTFAERFASLEILFHQEHLVAPAAGGEIGFARMSAAAPVIGAARFTCLHTHSAALDEAFTEDGDHLVPDVKLAGNELASFSAFLDERWRINDWTWGRSDAVATLVDLLLGEDRPAAERPEAAKFRDIPSNIDEGARRNRRSDEAPPNGWEDAGYGPNPSDEVCADRRALRRALIARRQAEIRSEAGDELPGDLAAWEAGVETLVRPGSPALAKQIGDVASVGARVVGASLPRTVPRITGQLDGVARWLAKRLSRPQGGLIPVPTRRSGEGQPLDPPREPRDASTRRALHVAVAVPVGTAAAALVWAVADHPLSLAIGLVVGLASALLPGGLLLWLAVQPPSDGRGRAASGRGVAIGIMLGALGCVVIAAVAAAVWRAAT